MFSVTIRSLIEGDKILIAPSNSTVIDAARRMAEREVGAMLVVDEGKLVGIFTERDALCRVMAAELNPETTRLADVMTADPVTVSPDKSYGFALLTMHDNGFRHLPVMEDGRLVGIVSSRNALDPELEEYAFEESRRKHIMRERA